MVLLMVGGSVTVCAIENRGRVSLCVNDRRKMFYKFFGHKTLYTFLTFFTRPSGLKLFLGLTNVLEKKNTGKCGRKHLTTK